MKTRVAGHRQGDFIFYGGKNNETNDNAATAAGKNKTLFWLILFHGEYSTAFFI
jgi:hypothetical protein